MAPPVAIDGTDHLVAVDRDGHQVVLAQRLVRDRQQPRARRLQPLEGVGVQPPEGEGAQPTRHFGRRPLRDRHGVVRGALFARGQESSRRLGFRSF